MGVDIATLVPASLQGYLLLQTKSVSFSVITVTRSLPDKPSRVSTALLSSISFDIVRLMPERTALLINCSQQELELMRSYAEVEHRTLSGYVLNIVMRTVSFDETLFASLNRFAELAPLTPPQPHRPSGPRATTLLRCSVAEATRIRAAAKRRKTTISAYILHTLQRSWSVTKGLNDFPRYPFPSVPPPISGNFTEEAE